jgi:capsular exopolysaccharide synthesis family protein
MAEEGKMSRAMSKAGPVDRLSSKPTEAAPVVAAPRPVPAEFPVSAAAEQPAQVRLVRGKFGTPASCTVMVHDKFGEVASQVRALRARLLGMHKGHPPRVITVTSGSREEGKSTVSLNLAAAFAEVTEGRVILVDGDLVAPGLHLMAGVDADTGINNVLDDGLVLDGNVYETSIPNLDLLPARPIGEEKAYEGELSQNCAALVKKLRQMYSFVVIDTPPVLAASQASTFAKHSDGVLVLARLEKTPREVVRRTVEELEHSGATIVGCVLTHRRHHIPNFIYRFFGSTPHYYYAYSRSRYKTGKQTT